MIKILVLAANPRDTDPLRLGEEVRQIEARLREASEARRFSVRSAWAVTPDELMYQLNDFEPNIVHFSGHGDSAGHLILEADGGTSLPLSGDALQMVFANFSQWLQVVVLNACYSKEQAAALLVNVDAVVGMTNSIEDASAIEFAASFYRALGFGHSVEEAFRQATAALRLKRLSSAGEPTLEHREGVDPRQLRLAGASEFALALRRAQDPRLPEELRELLLAGRELVVLDDEELRLRGTKAVAENHIFVVLALRQSATVYVVEVNRHAAVAVAAEALANKIIPVEAYDYEWELDKDGEILASNLSLSMAGLKSGDRVLLLGNHLRPLWAPDMA